MLIFFRQSSSEKRNGEPGGGAGFFQVVFLCLVLSVGLFPGDAVAARKRVIFQLANLRQSIELTYDYFGSQSSGNNRSSFSSQRHEFGETYYLDIDYAILSSNLANGLLSLGLGMNQKFQRDSGGSRSRSDSTSGHLLEYRFELYAFEKESYPVTFVSSRNQERISSPFSNSYDQITESLRTQLYLRQRFLPVRLTYQNYKRTTEGINQNRSQTTSVLSLDAKLINDWLGETEAKAEAYDSNTSSEDRNTETDLQRHNIEVRNIFSWLAFSKNQRLYSYYKRQKEEGPSALNSVDWSERLELAFGKALSSSTRYTSRNLDAINQQQRTTRFRSWLEHRLYDSLTTRVHYSLQQNKHSTGHGNEWEQGVLVDYTKKLPLKSSLSLGYSHSSGNTRQFNSDNRQSVSDELMTVKLSANILQDTDIIESSIVVYSQDRSILYEKDIDYEVVSIPGGRTELLFFRSNLSSAIALNDVLSIDYAFLTNRAIKYRTTTDGVSAQLTMWQQRLNVYFSYSQTDQELLSGVLDTAPLVETRNFLAGSEVRLEKHDFGVRYSYLDSTLSTDRSVHGFWHYTTGYRRGTLILRWEDTYTVSQQNASTISEAGERLKTNVMMFHIDYKRIFNRALKMELNSHYYDIRRDDDDQQEVALGAKFEAALYKMRVLLEGEVTWKLLEDRTSRNDRIQLSVRRYF